MSYVLCANQPPSTPPSPFSASFLSFLLPLSLTHSLISSSSPSLWLSMKDPATEIDFLMHFFLSRELFISNAISRWGLLPSMDDLLHFPLISTHRIKAYLHFVHRLLSFVVLIELVPDAIPATSFNISQYFEHIMISFSSAGTSAGATTSCSWRIWQLWTITTLTRTREWVSWRWPELPMLRPTGRSVWASHLHFGLHGHFNLVDASDAIAIDLVGYEHSIFVRLVVQFINTIVNSCQS